MLIFISHSSKDKPIARKIVEALSSEGFSCWFDEQQLNVGDNLPRSLKKAIEKSEVFLYIASDAAKDSKWVQKELKYALNLWRRRPKVIPILLKENDISVLPRNLHASIARSLDSKGGVMSLIDDMKILKIYNEFSSVSDLTVVVRLEKTGVIHPIQQIRNKINSSNVYFIFVDESYLRLDELYRCLSEETFPVLRDENQQRIEYAAKFVHNIHKESKLIINELPYLCQRFISSDDRFKYYDSGYERILRCLLHKLEWNIKYLKHLKGDMQIDEYFANSARLPEPFDGHLCDFVVHKKTGQEIFSSVRVPSHGHPYPNSIERIVADSHRIVLKGHPDSRTR